MAEIKASDVQVGGSHYKDFIIQPAEFITKNNIGFLEGCVIKRMCRWKNKNGVEDLRKAIHEIELLMEFKHVSETGKLVHQEHSHEAASGTALRKDGKSVLKRNT